MSARLEVALNRLAKWRVLFTGWQLGTRPKGDPEGDAVRDHREVTILLRCELSAMTAALDEMFPSGDRAGFLETFRNKLLAEAEMLNADYERRFPGVKAGHDGLIFDKRAAETMKGWMP